MGINIPTDELIVFRGVGQPPTSLPIENGYAFETMGTTMPQSLEADAWMRIRELDPKLGNWDLEKWLVDIPFGKRLHKYGKIHHFEWENQLFLWPWLQ